VYSNLVVLNQCSFYLNLIKKLEKEEVITGRKNMVIASYCLLK